ncbi:MAG: hypothetical protein AAGM84_13820 [Pseudomonadota bacterium]
MAAATQTADDVAEDIGFALSCLRSDMVPLNTFKETLMKIIAQSDVDAIPACAFDLLDVQDRLDISRDVRLPKHVSFPKFLTDQRIDALIGLQLEQRAWQENLSNISDKRAAKALEACPEVRARFERLFGEGT